MTTGKAVWRDGYWIVKPDEQPTEATFERLGTWNGSEVAEVELQFADPRRARPKQRALFFALLQDIWRWSGEPVDWLKEYFYARYTIRTQGDEISLANGTSNSVTEARYLLDDVVKFIFEYDVPIRSGYMLLPREESNFQYECIKHRKCLICGRHADINHIDEVGMGRNRNHLDHTQARLSALCREHHQEFHQIGYQAFCSKYKLTGMGIKVDADTLKSIGLQGHYQEGGRNYERSLRE